MRALHYAYEILLILKNHGGGSIYQDGDTFFIPKSDDTPLVHISETAILVNRTNFNHRLTPSKQSRLVTKIEPNVFSGFLRDLTSVSTVYLNHLGMSYYCRDIPTEVSQLQKTLGDNNLYEEPSGNPTTKWLFIGDKDQPSKPMFEFVLNQRAKPVLSSWTPHVQIDIDTTVSLEQLQKIIKKHLGDNWIKWSMSVENWGVPLVVGRLCSIDGLKVYLAIGTNKRGRQWHRTEGMKRL